MITNRPLEADELSGFEHYRRIGLQLLGVPATAEPKRLVEAVDAFVDQWQKTRSGWIARARARKEAIDSARGLGVVWGDQIVRQFDWSWLCVLSNDEERFAVAAPDRSLVIYAPQFITACLEDPRMDCTAMLAFNMQAEGQFTGVEANEYVDVMSGVRRIVPKR